MPLTPKKAEPRDFLKEPITTKIETYTNLLDDITNRKNFLEETILKLQDENEKLKREFRKKEKKPQSNKSRDLLLEAKIYLERAGIYKALNNRTNFGKQMLELAKRIGDELDAE